MDTKTLTAVIVTALIVAVLTSLITVKLTGNVVNVQPSTTTQPVYNTTEIDLKLESKLDSSRVLFDEYTKLVKGRLDISRDDNYYGGIITSLRSSFRGVSSLPLVEIGREYDPVSNKSDPYITLNSYNFKKAGNYIEPAGINITTRGDSYFYGSNLGIGTKKPTQKLDVNGTIRSQSLVGSGIGYVCVNATGVIYRSISPCDQK